jgi:hypothetical protein
MVVDLHSDRVAAAYLGGKMTADPSPPARTFITIDPRSVTQFLGVYSAGIRRFEISEREGKLLIAQLGLPNQVELKPMTPSRFYAPDIQAEVEFKPTPGGMQFRIMRGNGSIRSGERVSLARFDSNDLQSYAGRYRSEELETQYTVVVKDEKLSIQHLHLGEIALLPPIAKDEFSNGSSLTVKFTRDGAGTVAAMLMKRNAVTAVPFVRR